MRSSAQLRQRKGPTFWNALNRVLIILVTVGLVAILILWFYPELERRNAIAENLEIKRAELAETELLRKKREREIFLLENDPEYLETVARDKFDLMKEGETIFRLDPSKSKLKTEPQKN